MGDIVRNYTQRLFATPSFFEGMGRLLDFANLFETYNTDATDKEADANATLADWSAVGQDLRYAFTEYGRQ